MNNSKKTSLDRFIKFVDNRISNRQLDRIISEADNLEYPQNKNIENYLALLKKTPKEPNSEILNTSIAFNNKGFREIANKDGKFNFEKTVPTELVRKLDPIPIAAEINFDIGNPEIEVISLPFQIKTPQSSSFEFILEEDHPYIKLFLSDVKNLGSSTLEVYHEDEKKPIQWQNFPRNWKMKFGLNKLILKLKDTQNNLLISYYLNLNLINQ